MEVGGRFSLIYASSGLGGNREAKTIFDPPRQADPCLEWPRRESRSEINSNGGCPHLFRSSTFSKCQHMLRLECTTNGNMISLPDSRRCNWRPNTRGIDRSLRDSRRGHSRRRGLSPLYRFAIPADTPGGPLDYIWRSLGLNVDVI